MDFHSLTRKELQALCKKNKIPANMTNVAMADALKSLEIVEGWDEIVNQCQSPEKTVERAGSRASTRRKPTKEPQSTQQTTQTRRSTRRAAAGSNDGENKHVNVPETPKMPITASRSRRVTDALAQCRMESQEVGTPAVQAVHRRDPMSSVVRKGKRQEEVSAQQVNSTRRSVRLLEKSLDNLSLNDKEIVQPEVAAIGQKVEDQVEKKDVDSGAVGQEVSDNVQHQQGSGDIDGMEKSSEDAENSVDSYNVAGLQEKDGGRKSSDMTDGSHDHLDNNPQDVHDVSPVQTSVGNFVGEEIGSTPNSEQVDLLVSESSDMEVPKLAVASLGAVQDESTASEHVADNGYEGLARKDSAVEDNKGMSDDQGRLQTENGMTNLRESYVKSSDDSDVEEPMQYENAASEDDVEAIGYEVSARKDFAVEDNRGTSNDEDQGSYDQFSDDSDDFSASDAVHVDMDEEPNAHTGDASAKEARFEAYSSEDGLKEMEKVRYIRNSTPAHLLDTERAPQLAPSQEEVEPIQGEISIFETLSCNGVPAQPAIADNYAMPADEHAHEQMNIAVMVSTTDVKNNGAEESSITTCIESPLIDICEMPAEEPSGLPSLLIGHEEVTSVDIHVMPAVSNSATEMRNSEIEGSSSLVTAIVPAVLPESELPQPNQSPSKMQLDQNKENIGVAVKKKELPELVNKSMRTLKKMLAEKLSKLDINGSAENTEEEVAAKVRPALRMLPDNRMLENC